MKKYVVLLFAALLLAALVACKEGAVSENGTTNVEATSPSSDTPSMSTQAPESVDDTPNASKIATREIVFNEGDITIRYPEVFGMDDESVQLEANDQIKSDALEVGIFYGQGLGDVKPYVAIDISYQILALDSEKITIEFFGTVMQGFEGSVEEITYSSTISLITGERIEKMGKFADW
ncbi:MAG: hypothetical protein LBB42_04065 [Coriobacteriales bacterium]|jgi:hypothetical protein|nr:hypothetical protein [Coriobacteriales bacterium]